MEFEQKEVGRVSKGDAEESKLSVLLESRNIVFYDKASFFSALGGGTKPSCQIFCWYTCSLCKFVYVICTCTCTHLHPHLHP